MADKLSKARRSWNMSRIRGTNTRPEVTVRSFLHRQGLRFRLHHRILPGRPDIVLTRSRTAVFVHGCFWHRHKRCKFAYTPKSNITFWQEKFLENVARDSRVVRRIRAMGWRVVVVWECQVHDFDLLIRRIVIPHREHKL
jgi:DNA mismatch endonuclease, patch repair protein